jgi:hypothetical protein
MKNILIASVVAFASFAGVSTPSQAAMIHHRHCFVKVVKHRVHGHVVVRKERVCR